MARAGTFPTSPLGIGDGLPPGEAAAFLPERIRSFAELLAGGPERGVVALLLTGEAPLVPGLAAEPVSRPEQAEGLR